MKPLFSWKTVIISISLSTAFWLGYNHALAESSVSTGSPVSTAEKVSQKDVMQMPDWTDLAGKPYQLPAETNYQLVVFWATWCTDCRGKMQKELPEIHKLPGVHVTAVNMDRSTKRAQHFLQENGISLPVVKDSSKTLQKKYRIYSVPHWLVAKRLTAEKTPKGEGLGAKAAQAKWQILDQNSGFQMERINRLLRVGQPSQVGDQAQKDKSVESTQEI